MYAIVEIAGKQFKVAQDQKVFVNRLHNDEGSEITFDTVMLKDNDGNVQVGQPYIAGANVKATVLKHLKGDKVFSLSIKSLFSLTVIPLPSSAILASAGRF